MIELFLETLSSLISYINHLIIFIGSFYYLIKSKNLISITLFLGSLIVLLTSILSRVLLNHITLYGSEQFVQINDILKLSNGLKLLGSVIFSIGFIMLIIKLTKIKKTNI